MVIINAMFTTVKIDVYLVTISSISHKDIKVMF